MASIVVYMGDDRTRTAAYRLAGGIYAIGRAHGGRIQIVDVQVSRTHCVIRYDAKNRHYNLVDYGSTNSTTVNGKPLSTIHQLQEGDKIGLGKNVELLFHEHDVSDAVAPDKQKDPTHRHEETERGPSPDGAADPQ